MKSWMMALILCLSVGTAAWGQSSKTGDVQSFELTATPPGARYWLLTDPREQLAGNSAFLYADAAATLNDTINKETGDALEAYWAGNLDRFDSLADVVEKSKVYVNSTVNDTFDLLAVAAKRADYEWDSSFREQGGLTLIPHIVGERKLIDLINVRALRQIRAGKLDDAAATIRLGFELGRKCGREQLLLCGLVGSAIIERSAKVTAELMKEPLSPNLYWALAGLPRPMVSFQNAMFGEFADLRATFPELRTGRPQDVSAEGWHHIFAMFADMLPNRQTQTEQMTQAIPQARDWYARTYGMSADQVDRLDTFKVVATYWFSQGEYLRLRMYTLTALPDPVMISEGEKFDRDLKQMMASEPANPFLESIPLAVPKLVERFIKEDRMLAALTDVEAIRSYAAANGGKLPAHLEDITDTPAVENPRTGRQFGFEVEGDKATLSDPEPADDALSYSVKIRQ
jgi:hypothetical protein